MAEYNPQQIEAKWQKRWAEARVFETEADPAKLKYYALEMLPYPSGTLHMCHIPEQDASPHVDQQQHR